MKQISVTLSSEQIDWLDSMLNRSSALRLLIQDAMEAGWSPFGRRRTNGATRPKAVRAEALSAYAENDEDNTMKDDSNEQSLVWSVPGEKE